VRVRGVQIQHDQVTEALAGERPAVNVVGIEATEVPSGSTLVDPRAFETTTRFLAELTLLTRARPINDRTELEFLSGTTVTQGRVRVHAPGRALGPEETATAEIACGGPLVLVHGDLVLVRSIATNTTIGRARVLDPHPPAHIDPRAAAALQQAPSYAEAAARIVAAAGTLGVPERELARRIGTTRDGLTALVHGHKTYWTRDALTDAREALIKTIPAPGSRVSLEEWWAASPIRDATVLRNLTQQLAALFELRIEGSMLVTPRRKVRSRRRPARDAQARLRPVRLSPLLLARVERQLRSGGVMSLAHSKSVDDMRYEHFRAVIASLVASGRLVALGRSCVVHRNVLPRLEARLRLPATNREVAATLGATRAQAHALLGHLLKCDRLAFTNGLYRRKQTDNSTQGGRAVT